MFVCILTLSSFLRCCTVQSELPCAKSGWDRRCWNPVLRWPARSVRRRPEHAATVLHPHRARHLRGRPTGGRRTSTFTRGGKQGLKSRPQAFVEQGRLLLLLHFLLRIRSHARGRRGRRWCGGRRGQRLSGSHPLVQTLQKHLRYVWSAVFWWGGGGGRRTGRRFKAVTLCALSRSFVLVPL